MAFAGFHAEDFAVFQIPGYQDRMPALRARITPALKELAVELSPRLSAATGLELYPHVALHMRRSVNAPEETWAAFCRSTRSYKPFVHFRVAINAEAVNVACFVEDEADDKAVFGAGLVRNARALARYMKLHPEIRSYDLRDSKGLPRSGPRLDSATLKGFGERLLAVKGQHASFGIDYSPDDPAVSSLEGLTNLATHAAETLLPLYRMGAEPRYRI